MTIFVKRDKRKSVKSEKSENAKMDSRHGLDYIVENAEYTTKLGAGTYIIFNHFGSQL